MKDLTAIPNKNNAKDITIPDGSITEPRASTYPMAILHSQEHHHTRQ